MKKMIAPIIITVLIIIYLVIYFLVLVSLFDNLITSILVGVIPVAFAGVMIFVCVERIKEIRSGEEDDLSKY